MSALGHNSDAAGQLRAFVERIERLDEEAKALNDDRKEVYGEAKASGFDTKVMRKIIADRRRDAAERQEFDAIYETYAVALGMIPDFENEPKKPNDSYAHARPPAREENPTPDHDPETGEITDQPPAVPFKDDDGHPHPSEPAEPDESQRSSDEVNTKADPAVSSITGGEGSQENAVDPQDRNEPVSGEAAPVAPPPPPVQTVDDPVAVVLRLRPHCQNPTNCSSYGRRHCTTCQVVAASAGDAE